ncbi:hypothetical protein G5I_13956 [Acromyrmex echinatior]|uniref:Uncharacterized protein n=1 Tax=Acromyrmex echinatior TaxID=103372 RepID=F4X6D8_ACREC|nr:hypothetical protein G5I_13956 [Acromyrmex echinatior]
MLSADWDPRSSSDNERSNVLGVDEADFTINGSRSASFQIDKVSPATFLAFLKKNINVPEEMCSTKRKGKKIHQVSGSNVRRRTTVVQISRVVNPRRRLIRFAGKRRRSLKIEEINRVDTYTTRSKTEIKRERERERERETEGGRTTDFYENSVSRAFLCCKSSWKPGSNNGNGPPRDIQPLGAFACISIRYPFPGGREESPQSSRRVEAGRRLLCTSVHAPGAITDCGPAGTKSLNGIFHVRKRLIFDEGGAKWLVSSVRVNRGWSPKGPSRQLVEVSESRRLHGCGGQLHDDQPSPFHGHSKGSKRDGGALLPPCTVLSDKRRLRHAMQNDPIIAAGETGILGSRDEGRGMRELIRILLVRDEGGKGTRKGGIQGNAAARYP